MVSMTTDEYLMQIIKLERMIENKKEQILSFRDVLLSKTIENHEDKIQTSSDKDRLSTFTARIVDEEKEIEGLYERRKKIISQIESLPDPDLYQVLYSRYVDGISVNDARHKIHCSKTKIYSLYYRAIEEFEARYGKIYMKKSKKGKERTEKETLTD